MCDLRRLLGADDTEAVVRYVKTKCIESFRNIFARIWAPPLAGSYVAVFLPSAVGFVAKLTDLIIL